VYLRHTGRRYSQTREEAAAATRRPQLTEVAG
jgi:hypothetical protein